jgi:enterochelin esterase family protein
VYKDLLGLPEMLDYLVAAGQIPPVAALLVDHPDRNELLCRPEFAAYIANEALPWLRAAYPVAAGPDQTSVLGASYGGLAAVYTAFRRPDVFGAAFAQSGWFRWRPAGDPEHHWLARQVAAAPRVPARFCLQVGDLEVAQMADGGPSQLAANRHLRDVLREKGCAVSYHEYSGGHDASSQEHPLARGLVEILSV